LILLDLSIFKNLRTDCQELANFENFVCKRNAQQTKMLRRKMKKCAIKNGEKQPEKALFMP